MSDAIVTMKGAGARYGREWAIRGLDIDVPRGSCFGLLGRNGAGKTTTMRLIAGLMPATEGHVRVDDLDPWTDRIWTRETIGFAGDDIGLYPNWTVSRTIRFASRMFNDWNAAEGTRLLRRFDLPERKRVRALSKGNLARLKLLLVLARQPRVLVIDEPFAGLDVVIRREIIDDLIDYLPQGDRTVIVTSHLVHELERIVDRIAILSHGKAEFDGTLDDLKQSVRRVSLVAEAQDHPFERFAWVRRAERWGRGWRVTLTEFAPEKLAALEGEGFSIESVDALSLEDIAFEFLSGDRTDGGNGGREAA